MISMMLAYNKKCLELNLSVKYLQKLQKKDNNFFKYCLPERKGLFFFPRNSISLNWFNTDELKILNTNFF